MATAATDIKWLRIPAAVLDAIRRCQAAAPEEEIGGRLLIAEGRCGPRWSDDHRITGFEAFPNLSQSPRWWYRWPSALPDTPKGFAQVLLHSHPYAGGVASPSEGDIDWALAHGEDLIGIFAPPADLAVWRVRFEGEPDPWRATRVGDPGVLWWRLSLEVEHDANGHP